MANTYKDTKDTVYEGTAGYRIKFRVRDADTQAAIAPDSVKVHVENGSGVPNGTTINDRDGTTNTSGLTITDTNLITFITEAGDNTYVTSDRASAWRLVTIEVNYSSNTKKHFERFKYTLARL